MSKIATGPAISGWWVAMKFAHVGVKLTSDGCWMAFVEEVLRRHCEPMSAGRLCIAIGVAEWRWVSVVLIAAFAK